MKKILLLILTLFMFTGCSSSHSGKVEVKTGAVDEEFGIVTDSAILYREVEMVQWINDENGIRKVFANYPIESFTADGKEYTNPDFPIESAVFIGTSTIDGIELSEDVLKAMLFSDEASVETLTDLPTPNIKPLDLLVSDGSYVTADNEWDIGDVRITYKYLNDDSTFTISEKGDTYQLVLSSN